MNQFKFKNLISVYISDNEMMFKKRFCVFTIWLFLLSMWTFSARSEFVVDPPLTFAIVEQTELLQGEYKKRTEHHSKIEAAQAGIVIALNDIHSVEDKMLEYLSNASGAMQNLIQLKKIAELVVDDIPSNLVRLGKDIPDNLKGTGITLMVQNIVSDTMADILALSDVVDKLVTSKYSFKESKDKNDKNINLLSAAERFYILSDVLRRLNNINQRIYLTDFYIKTFSWRQLWMGLDRESWCKAVYGEVLTRNIVKHWNELCN